MRTLRNIPAMACAIVVGCTSQPDTPKVEQPAAVAPAAQLQFQGQPIDPSSVAITLERTECYGTCPSYSVTVHGDGSVDWNGRNFVAQTGERHGTVEPEVVRILVRRAEEVGCFQLAQEYTDPISDIPDSIITFQIGGRSTHVLTHSDGEHRNTGVEKPDWKIKFELLRLADAIDALAETWRWIYEGSGSVSEGSDVPGSTDVPRGFLLRLSRFTNYRSPQYEVSIDEQGHGRWHGTAYVQATGERTFDLPLDELRVLARRVTRAKCLDHDLPVLSGESPDHIALEVKWSERSIRREGTLYWQKTGTLWAPSSTEYFGLCALVDSIARVERFVGADDDRGASMWTVDGADDK